MRERRALPSGAGSPREGEARVAWWEGVASLPAVIHFASPLNTRKLARS